MKKTVLIVGAACSFGKELVEALADDTDTFILTEHPDRAEDMSRLFSAGLKVSKGSRILQYRVDITRLSEIDKLIANIEKKGIAVTDAIYCAGLNVIEPVLNVTEEIWERIMAVNLKGFFFLAKAVSAHMILANVKGNVLAIASQHAIVANYNRAAYCASKAGLVHLIKEMALEFAESGIRFNAISPSYIINDRNADQLFSYRLREDYLGKIPLGRYAGANDISGAVKYLISDAAGFITGHNLVLDGGYTIM